MAPEVVPLIEFRSAHRTYGIKVVADNLVTQDATCTSYQRQRWRWWYGLAITRDVAGTNRKIVTAGMAEFAEHGPHGTTIERIANRAGVNKERIYAYFGDKTALFTALLREQVDQVAAAVPLVVDSAFDLGTFAGATFDYQVAHPDLARLLVWEGMINTADVPEEPARGALYQAKVEAIAAAQRRGTIDDAIEPAHLVFFIFALASWWSVSPQIARMLSAPCGGDDVSRRRASVVEAAKRLAAPRNLSSEQA